MFAMISAMLTKGNVRVGLISFSGIMDAQSAYQTSHFGVRRPGVGWHTSVRGNPGAHLCSSLVSGGSSAPALPNVGAPTFQVLLEGCSQGLAGRDAGTGPFSRDHSPVLSRTQTSSTPPQRPHCSPFSSMLF